MLKALWRPVCWLPVGSGKHVKAGRQATA